MPVDNDLLLEFIAETKEYLASLDDALLALQQRGQDTEHLNEAFRLLHTIKGTAGFIGLDELQEIAHRAESRLAEVRAGQRAFDQHLANSLLEVLDYIRAVVDSVENGEAPPPAPTHLLSQSETSHSEPDSPVESHNKDTSEEKLTGVDDRARASATTVRVRTRTIDTLINVLGELAIARNELSEAIARACDLAARRRVQRLSQLVDEVQDAAIKLRMQPISVVFRRLPRLVHDVARNSGKQVHLRIEGEETEIDRSLAEPLPDILLHLIRNAIDHGIESPEEREQCGKPPYGRLVLRAHQQNGRVIIELADDGRGIDPARLRSVAVERGLLTQEEAEHLTDSEAVALIFRPGFSTAERTTELSGRGVGMDAVRHALERVGGGIHVASEPGEGTVFTISLPSNLTVIPAVYVSIGERNFALPTSCIDTILRVTPGDSRIQKARGTHGLLIDNTFVPVYNLKDVLEHSPRYIAATDRVQYVVLIRTESDRAGFAVDHVGDVRDVFVKPLQQPLQRHTLFSGACIEGNGQLTLIVDPFKLVASVPATAPVQNQGKSSAVSDGLQVLLVRVDQITLGLPLERVTHVVRGIRGAIHQSLSGTFLRWYDMLLPVVPAVDTTKDISEYDEAALCIADNALFAVPVDCVIDLVEAPPDYPEKRSRDPRWLGYGVIAGEVVPLLNVSRLALFVPHTQFES